MTKSTKTKKSTYGDQIESLYSIVGLKSDILVACNQLLAVANDAQNLNKGFISERVIEIINELQDISKEV